MRPHIDASISDSAVDDLRRAGALEPIDASLQAERILCWLLIDLGYTDVVNEYDQLTGAMT